MVIDLARVHGSARAYELQQELRPLPACSRPRPKACGWDRGIGAWMHERLDGTCYEAVVNEEVFLDTEFRVALFEVAGTVVRDTMTKDQVLSARGSANWVGLNEA